MERIVKFRLITWFEPVEDPTVPGGQVMREHINTLGQKVDLPDGEAARLDKLGALYTEEEAAAIEDGSYNGFDRHILASARQGSYAPQLIQPTDGEGVDVSGMSAEELGDYVKEHQLTVQQFLALVPEDADEETLDKFYDAENFASDNSPRKGVTDKLDAMLAASTQK